MFSIVVSLLLKREETAGVKDIGVSLSTSENITKENFRESNMVSCSSRVSVNQTAASIGDQGFGPSTNEYLGSICGETTKENPMIMMGNERKKLAPWCGLTSKKKARNGNSSQLTMKCFFQKDNPRSSVNVGSADNNLSSSQVDLSKETDSPNETYSRDGEETSSQDHEINEVLSQDQAGTDACCSSKKIMSDPLLEWRRIQELMQNSVPLCKGHGEPCVARSVKKAGPNVGRGFYVCARAEVLKIYDSI